MIPNFDKDGYLPEGVHTATLEEVIERFLFSKKRETLIIGLKRLIDFCLSKKINILFLNGSFISRKLNPTDYDVCYTTNHPDKNTILKEVESSFRHGDLEEKFGCQIFYAYSIADSKNNCFIDFFQQRKEEARKRKPKKKGIIKLILTNYDQE